MGWNYTDTDNGYGMFTQQFISEMHYLATFIKRNEKNAHNSSSFNHYQQTIKVHKI